MKYKTKQKRHKLDETLNKVVILSQIFFTFQQWRVHQSCIGSVKNRSVLWKLGSEMKMVRLECDGLCQVISPRPWEHLEHHADHDEHHPQHRQDPDRDRVHEEGEGAPLRILGAGHWSLHLVHHDQESIPKYCHHSRINLDNTLYISIPHYVQSL